MKNTRTLLISIIIVSFAIITTSYAAKEFDLPIDVPLDKVWTILFNNKVDGNSINEDTIYILDEEQNKILLDYKVLGSRVELFNKQGYRANTDSTNNNILWSVENGIGSAEITESGLLEGISAGTVTVKALSEDGSGVFATKEIEIAIPLTIVRHEGVSK